MQEVALKSGCRRTKRLSVNERHYRPAKSGVALVLFQIYKYLKHILVSFSYQRQVYYF
jgi:hypothetical protein